MKVALYTAAVFGILGLGIWYEISVWNECRLTNSWLYCTRVLSK